VEVLQRIGEIEIIPTRCLLGRRFVNSCVQHRFPGVELLSSDIDTLIPQLLLASRSDFEAKP
jgi:hypothetical protein